MTAASAGRARLVHQRPAQSLDRAGAEARHRLQQAALDLYRERGYDQTTTAEIAARAGFNHRTFFRHFPDKREVLFAGEADLRAALTQAVLAQALRQRGVAERMAGLAAQAGWAAFHHALQAWIDDSSRGLDAHLLQAIDDLRVLLFQLHT